MKNLYLLSTVKPSRLYSYYGTLEDLSYGKTFTFVNEDIAKINLHKDLKDYQKNIIKAGWKAENIYITNSEEIKEGDYIYDIEDKEVCYVRDKAYLYNLSRLAKNRCKKIIITTDTDLIQDGIQAIDDTFLKWFVAHPSCEEVEVESKDFYYDKEYWYTHYKIIIPKEEQKLERMYSEPELKEMVYHLVGELAKNNNMTFNGAILDELFEQFKKK